MSIKKALQNLGIVEKETTEESKPAPKSLTVADVRSIGEPQTSAPFSNEQLEAHLEQSIAANPDFAPATTFLAALDAIRDVITEEGLRFRTAQATTKLSTPMLITALQAHDAALQYEARQFEQSVVDPGIANINNLTAQSGALQAQIDALQKQITELAAQKDTVNAEIITSGSDLDKAKIDFKATQTKVSQRYGDLARKVSQYLGGTNG